MRRKAKSLICFGLSCVVFPSSHSCFEWFGVVVVVVVVAVVVVLFFFLFFYCLNLPSRFKTKYKEKAIAALIRTGTVNSISGVI